MPSFFIHVLYVFLLSLFIFSEKSWFYAFFFEKKKKDLWVVEVETMLSLEKFETPAKIGGLAWKNLKEYYSPENLFYNTWL